MPPSKYAEYTAWPPTNSGSALALVPVVGAPPLESLPPLATGSRPSGWPTTCTWLPLPDWSKMRVITQAASAGALLGVPQLAQPMQPGSGGQAPGDCWSQWLGQELARNTSQHGPGAHSGAGGPGLGGMGVSALQKAVCAAASANPPGPSVLTFIVCRSALRTTWYSGPA